MVEHIHKFFPAVGIFHTRGFRSHDREYTPQHAEKVHKNQRDDVNGNAVAQHRHHLGGAVKPFPFMYRAENA